MIHNKKYLFAKEAISPRHLHLLEQETGYKKRERATIFGQQQAEENQEVIKNTRNSHVVWLKDWWMYRLLHPYINEANEKCDWNYDWRTSEGLQYTEYDKDGFYNWHPDYNDMRGSNSAYPDYVRKISVTVLLSDKSEFEGGDFELSWVDGKNQQNFLIVDQLQNKGDMVIFPSYMMHRVNKVTEGLRKSLVCWSIGPRFK